MVEFAVNPCDLVCIFMLILSGFVGYYKGFVVHTGKWIALGVSLFIARYCIPFKGVYHWQELAGLTCISVAIWSILLLILGRISAMLKRSHLSIVNSVLGVFGGVIHGLVVMFAMFVTAEFSLKRVPSEILMSHFYGFYKLAMGFILTRYGGVLSGITLRTIVGL